MATKLRSQLGSYVKNVDPDDSLCEGCEVRGSCCYGAVKYDGEVYGLKSARCKLLGDDGRCKDYSNRHEKVPTCLPIVDAIMQKAVPNECAYVKGIKGYNGKIIADKYQEKELLKEMAKSITSIPEYCNDELKVFLGKYAQKVNVKKEGYNV
jgi:uncharacterized cysteine cluster protein YcgN (CxxCxxCC family)